MKNTKTIKERLAERRIEAELLEELFSCLENNEKWYMDYETNEDGDVLWKEPTLDQKKLKLEKWREIQKRIEKEFGIQDI